MTEITMPRLSDSMEEGTILTWLKADGETIAVGEELVEIETDKATMTYESPAEGVVNIVAEAGTSVAVGAVIARLSAAVEAAVTEQSEFYAAMSPDPLGWAARVRAGVGDIADRLAWASFSPIARTWPPLT
jgi:pyruvate dehydrogenase E2 component (dihydrolipoamide acetyltransferase)